MMEIYILQAGKELGPFTEEQVRIFFEEGLISRADLAWHSGMTDWETVEVVLARRNHFYITEPHPPVEEPATAFAPEPEPEDATTLIPELFTHYRDVVHEAVAEPEIDPHGEPEGSVVADEPLVPPAAPDPGPPRKQSPKAKRKPGKGFIQSMLELNVPASPPKKVRKTKARPDWAQAPSSTEAPTVVESFATPSQSAPNEPVANGTLDSFAERTTAVAPSAAPLPERAPVAQATVLRAPKRTSVPIRNRPSSGWPAWLAWPQMLGGFALLIVFGGVLYYFEIPPDQTIAQASPAPSDQAQTQPQPDNATAPSPAPPAGTPAVESDPKTAEDFTNRGYAKQAKGDYDGAIVDYNQALNLDPKDTLACYRRGVARQAKGDAEGAIADYTQAVGIDSRYADAYSSRGFLMQSKGDLDGALADYTHALLIDPKNTVTLYNRALIKGHRGDLDGAIMDYDHVLEIDPKMAIAYYNRGNAKSTEGDLDGAIDDYTQALGLDKKLTLAYSHRGFARQSKGDLDGAVADYTQALNLNPKLTAAFYNRGLLKEQLGDLDGAIADTTQALALDPTDAQAYCNRGLARLGKQDLDGALSDLQKFCTLGPKNADTDYARLYIWLIATQKNPNGNADRDLQASLVHDWSSPPEDLSSKIGSFLLGHMNESTLIANADSPDQSRDPGQHCKVWYFAGMKQLLAGNKDKASDYFKKCIATGQKDYCEYLFAKAQLQSLGS